MNNNYPNIQLEAAQKKGFNRLFLLNIVALLFLFASLFRSWYTLRMLMDRSKPVIIVPIWYYLEPVIHLLILVFQFLLLYGLILLRRELANYQEEQHFEFEKER